MDHAVERRAMTHQPDNSTNDAADGWLPTLGDIRHFYPGAHIEPLPELRRALAAEAAAPAQLARPKRQRKQRPAAFIKRIEKETGKTVTAFTVAADGTVTSVTFDGAPTAELNPFEREAVKLRRRKQGGP